jgi:hypothetical protein
MKEHAMHMTAFSAMLLVESLQLSDLEMLGKQTSFSALLLAMGFSFGLSNALCSSSGTLPIFLLPYDGV